jgi:hypothetical protein
MIGRGQRKMSQVLGMFVMLDFIMLRPVLETADTESADMGAQLYVLILPLITVHNVHLNHYCFHIY